MSLYEEWIKAAYENQGTTNKKFWSFYMPIETRIYEDILSPDAITEGKGGLHMPLQDFAKRYGLKPEHAAGFLDGINGALDTEIDVESITCDYVIDISFDLEKLFKKMVQYKAKHLYTLPQWDGVFSRDKQEMMADEQRRSGTVVIGEKPGRNDPCPCGSGKKYKICCANK